ncbi:ribosome maturation factor RimM [Rubeoparvulum massiliense]|uniref:ribosome maturation factor RimM n=1 Tax=Rubeoparvulum massiliense TaxID=1631346 RepID=UPI00065E0830|nr:ribosome maturation factor RimM [Rubeoparvulum massiliense]
MKEKKHETAELLRVGTIVNTHGIRGEVRVLSITDFPEERYGAGNLLYLTHPQTKQELELTVESQRTHKQFQLLKFHGLDRIEDVEGFKGCPLYAKELLHNALEDGEFYFSDIIGCRVELEDGTIIGTVKSILQPGANDVWVVEEVGSRREILIPYIDPVVKQVNVEEKRILIVPMEGLL